MWKDNKLLKQNTDKDCRTIFKDLRANGKVE
jgi:hypothetical protein